MIIMSKKSSKKSRKDIIDNLFGVLTESPQTITDIASMIKSYHSTVRETLELIEVIQNYPKVIIEKTGHNYQVHIKK